MAVPIFIPPTQYKDSLLFTPLSLVFGVSRSVQTGMRQCLSVVFICIPLMISDVQPFLAPVGHFMSTLGKNLLNSFAPFCFFIKFWGLLFVFLLSCMSSLCIFVLTPCKIQDSNVFTHPESCLVTFYFLLCMCLGVHIAVRGQLKGRHQPLLLWVLCNGHGGAVSGTASSVPAATERWVLGIELRSRWNKHLFPLSYLASPWRLPLYCCFFVESS